MQQELHRAFALPESQIWTQIAPPEPRASAPHPHPPSQKSHSSSSSSLTSVPQDALDAVFGPPLVVLLLLLLDLVLVLLLVAFHPELAPHDAADGADCGENKGKY